MAANIFQNGGVDNNWGTVGNWSLGAIPTSTDGNIATFDATSPNCTVNTNVRPCNHIDFSAYTNTITMTFGIEINGDCTLGASMGIAGSGGGLQFAFAGCNARSNGKVWTNNFGTTTPVAGAGGVGITLLDDWVVTGSLSFASSLSSGHTINGFSLTFGGGLSVFGNGNRTLAGTTQLIANGTGSITTGVNSWISPQLEINTSGTITFVTRFYKRSGLFKYTSGTTQTNNCTFVFGSASLTIDVNGDTSPSATTLSTTGINFYNLDTTDAITNALSSPIRVINSHTHGQGNFSAGNIYNKGSITLTINTPVSSVVMTFDGTGSWSGNFNARNKFVINTTGTFTLNGTLTINTGFYLEYISGTTICNGTLTLGAVVTLDVNGDSSPSATTTSSTGINFNNLTSTASAAHTIIGSIRICGTHIHGRSNFGTGKNIYNNGSLTVTTNTGAALYNYYMDGTGTITTSAAIRHNLILNTTGTITFTSLTFGGVAGATLTYVPNTGTVNAGLLLLGNLGIATTLNTNVLTFSTVQFQGTPTTTTLNSTLKCTSLNFLVNATFAGTSGFETNNLSISTSANITVTLVNGIRYLIKQSLITNTPGFTRLFTCASGAALLDLQYGATQDLADTSATRINSLGGQTIYTTGTLTTTQNWNTGTYRNPNNFMIMF